MQQETPADDAAEPIAKAQAPPRRIIKPKSFITKTLIAANLLVFVAAIFLGGFGSLFSPSVDTLLREGANFGPLTCEGQYWRTVSNMFVHIGIMHIAMNMWVLSDVGQTVETLFGCSKFLIIYLLAGIAGSLNSLFWSPLNISAGASGAVFGAFGAMLVFFWINRKHFPPQILKTHSQRVMILIVFNLLYGFATPGIDNSAHIGGLIGGFLAGFCLIPAAPGKNNWRFIDLIRLALLVVAVYFFGKVDMQRLRANPEAQAYRVELVAAAPLKAGKYKDAVTALDKILATDPANAAAYGYRAMAYRALGQFAKAIADCDHTLALDPHSPDALVVRAASYNALGENEKAIADFSQAISLEPDRPDAWNGRAASYTAIGDYKRAINDAAKAVNLDRNFSPAYDTLGMAYERDNQFDKALAALDRAIDIDPRSIPAYHHRAVIYYKLGQNSKAEKDYSMARHLELGYPRGTEEHRADR